jgi:hypothetical protein
MPGAKIFFGGLGQVAGGLTFAPHFHGVLNRHPFPNVVHGCLLEGMALALEGRFEPFSKGRGFITRRQVAQIEEIAARHGIYLAPLLQRRRTPDHRAHDRWPRGRWTAGRCVDSWRDAPRGCRLLLSYCSLKTPLIRILGCARVGLGSGRFPVSP